MDVLVSAVNQKKVFAELLLSQAETALAQRHLQQALLQSAALQLEHAYRFYLGEIGANYQCKEPSRLTELWTLIANLQLQGKVPAETAEIYNLEEDEESWLSQLLSCCRAISSPPEKAVPVSEDPNRIPVFSTSQKAEWSSLSCKQVRQWIGSFSELVERHRQSMVEC